MSAKKPDRNDKKAAAIAFELDGLNGNLKHIGGRLPARLRTYR